MTTAATEKLQLKIGGMHCSLCVKSIRKALGRVDGVQSVQVSIAGRPTRVDLPARDIRPAERSADRTRLVRMMSCTGTATRRGFSS
jgi:copper chaperone CopZ